MKQAAFSPNPQHHNSTRLTLLLADTDGPAPPAGGLGVLTTDTETPVVTETSVGADLLQALKVLTELGVNTVGEDLTVLAVDDVALSVQEPGWDLVLSWVLDDGNDALELFGGEFTGTGICMLDLVLETGGFSTCVIPLGEVDIGLLADQVGVAATDTLDLGQGVHDLLLAINLYNPSISDHSLQFHQIIRTLVLSRRRMNWKFDFSPETRDMIAVLSWSCRWKNRCRLTRGSRFSIRASRKCAVPPSPLGRLRMFPLRPISPASTSRLPVLMELTCIASYATFSYITLCACIVHT